MGIQSFDEKEIKYLLPRNKTSLVNCTFFSSFILFIYFIFSIT